MAAVIGVPSLGAGEVPKAFVVLRGGRRVSSDEFVTFLAERLAPFKVAQEIELVSDLPRASDGKVSKHGRAKANERRAWLVSRPTRVLWQSGSQSREAQPAHPALIMQSLDRQLSLYSEWLATRREDVLRLDNSACSLRTVQRLFSEGLVC